MYTIVIQFIFLIYIIFVFNRITSLPGELCGIRVTNVTIADRGHWRLTSKNSNYIARGMCSVTVLGL